MMIASLDGFYDIRLLTDESILFLMIRAKIVAEGNVQKADYRDIIEDIAVKLGVKGFVENLRDKTVCVVCEAKKEVIDRFVDAIKIKNDIVDVKSVKIVETSPATNEFKYFDIKYGSPEEELGERMVAAVKYAKLALHETRGVGEEVKGSREDIQNMHKDMRKGQNCIKDSIQNMHQDMNKRFDWVAEKYGDIGTGINSIKDDLGELKNMGNDVKEMKNLFEKLLNQIIKE